MMPSCLPDLLTGLYAPWVALNDGQERRAPWPGRSNPGVGALVIGLSSGPAVRTGS
ncbi:MAG: hypothetical protein ACQEXV_25125 [Bacillota bacterium]